MKATAELSSAQFTLYQNSGVRTSTQISVTESNLQSVVVSSDGGSAFSDPVAYDAGAHRFLRFREDAGVVFIETSANGTNYRVFSQSRTELRLSEVLVDLAIYQVQPRGDAGPTIFFDNFNTVP